MASGYSGVWAIDIGNNSLKALRLTDESGSVEVTGFDCVEHDKMLVGSDITPEEKDELVAISLRKFIKQNNVSKNDIIISVPSQNSFARFVNLPPVEEKRIPEIVKFEAAQQIPFDINDVQWDWQQMSKPESKEIRAGIFAIKNEIVNSLLEHFGTENLAVTHVQMSSMALYNYVLHDRPELFKTERHGVVILDIGAESSDLVVSTSNSVWQRNISIGGNNFTRAIAQAFKLNFNKAEKLKRKAPMSKYARQVFQAMRPVFADMASEIQRSLGYYNNTNPNTKLKCMIAFGGGTKLQGLLKYFQQSLQMPVETPDSFKKLKLNDDVSPTKFHDNVSDFGIVYGMGLQVLGYGKIESNLLPSSIARSMAWAAKSKFFIAATCLFLVAAVLGFARTTLDKVNYGKEDSTRRVTSRIVSQAQQNIQQVEAQKARAQDSQALIEKQLELFKNRDIVPVLREIIIESLPNADNNPSQKFLYHAFNNGDADTVMATDRKERKQLFVTYMNIDYSTDLENAVFKDIPFTSGTSRRYTERRNYNANPVQYNSASGNKDSQNIDPNTGQPILPQGFSVTLAGYSPYKDIGELLDPIGVGNDRSRWGLVTRLMRWGQTDPNSPFELYKKRDAGHYSIETGLVSPDAAMPVGIGQKIEKVVNEGSPRGGMDTYVPQSSYGAMGGGGFGQGILNNGKLTVLIDPMTKETISKVPKLDKNGRPEMVGGKVDFETNDSWFKLNFKILWKDAPPDPTAITPQQMPEDF